MTRVFETVALALDEPAIAGVRCFQSMDNRPRWSADLDGRCAVFADIRMERVAFEPQVLKAARQAGLPHAQGATLELMRHPDLLSCLHSQGFDGFVQSDLHGARVMVFNAHCIQELEGIRKKCAIAQVDFNTHTNSAPTSKLERELMSWVLSHLRDENLADQLRDKVLECQAMDPHIDLNKDCASNGVLLFKLANNLDALRVLVQLGANPKIRNKKLQNMLHASPNAATIGWLMEQGVDIHAADGTGQTPLHSMSHLKATQKIALLMAHGADVHAKDPHGKTPLHGFIRNSVEYEAQWAAEECFMQLIHAGSRINEPDHEGRTPLHEAAESGNHLGALRLIQEGADIDAEDHRGLRPIHRALKEERNIHVLLAWAPAPVAFFLINHLWIKKFAKPLCAPH